MPIQSRTRGVALWIIGWLMQLLGLVIEVSWLGVGMWLLHSEENLVWLSAFSILAVIAAFVFYWGRRLTVRGRQHLSPILYSPEKIPEGPFVLYLRSFDDDSAQQETESLGGRYGDNPACQNIIRSTRTREEQLVAALKPAGHVIALGRPGERLPFAGARRMYLQDDAWQLTVLDLMRQARLVVMAAGTSHGLMWELLQAVRNVNPHQFVLIVAMDSELYSSFRDMATKEFGVTARQLHMDTGQEWCPPTLPASLPERNRTTTRAWMILFADDWTAKPVVLDLPPNGLALYQKQTEKSISRALQPVFRSLA